VENLFVV